MKRDTIWMFGILFAVVVAVILVSVSAVPRSGDVKAMLVEQRVFRTYIPIQYNVSKQVESFIDRIGVEGYRIRSILETPRYTDAVVYDSAGEVDHTIQYTLGFDIVAIGEKY